MRCQTPGHSPYPSRIGSGVTARRDGLPGGHNLDDKRKILEARKTLLDIIVEDKEVIKSKEEKLKTLETFKRIWKDQDDDVLRQKTFKLLGKSTLALSK
jgi:hypothetical protein